MFRDKKQGSAGSRPSGEPAGKTEGKIMDAVSSAKIYEPKAARAKKNDGRGFWFRRAVDSGLIVMEDSQTKPPGFYVNGTTILGFIIIGAIIIGCFAYAVNVARESGIEQGRNETEKRELERRLSQAEKDAKQAKELNLLNNTSEREENKK